jgi:hypothetical protein
MDELLDLPLSRAEFISDAYHGMSLGVHCHSEVDCSLTSGMAMELPCGGAVAPFFNSAPFFTDVFGFS